MLTLTALLSLAVYRATRFLVADSLIAEVRARVLRRLAEASARAGLVGATARKLHDLLVCPYCVSVWVALTFTATTAAATSVPAPVLVGTAAAGGAMVVWRFVEE